MKRGLFITILIAGSIHLAHAQSASKEEVRNVLRKLATGYQNAAHLGFDVLYRYAAETEPSLYRDSLSGHFKLQGNRYWYDLDNTESVSTPEYTIMLFKDDKLMYLTKPVQQANATPAAQLAMIDSFLTAGKDIRSNIIHTKEQDIATIEFAAPTVYKQITWYIDKKTGYLAKMVSVVQAGQLYDASVRSQLEGPVAWAIVEAVYSNYQQQPFDEVLFNSSRYVKKEGNEYISVAPYEDYKVFLGSVGL